MIYTASVAAWFTSSLKAAVHGTLFTWRLAQHLLIHSLVKLPLSLSSALLALQISQVSQVSQPVDLKSNAPIQGWRGGAGAGIPPRNRRELNNLLRLQRSSVSLELGWIILIADRDSYYGIRRKKSLRIWADLRKEGYWFYGNVWGRGDFTTHHDMSEKWNHVHPRTNTLLMCHFRHSR